MIFKFNGKIITDSYLRKKLLNNNMATSNVSYLEDQGRSDIANRIIKRLEIEPILINAEDVANLIEKNISETNIDDYSFIVNLPEEQFLTVIFLLYSNKLTEEEIKNNIIGDSNYQTRTEYLLSKLEF